MMWPMMSHKPTPFYPNPKSGHFVPVGKPPCFDQKTRFKFDSKIKNHKRVLKLHRWFRPRWWLLIPSQGCYSPKSYQGITQKSRQNQSKPVLHITSNYHFWSINSLFEPKVKISMTTYDESYSHAQK